MDTALVLILLEVALTSASTKNLSLDNASYFALIPELLGNKVSFLAVVSYLTVRDGHLVGLEQCSCLILVQLQSSHGNVFVRDERSIEETSFAREVLAEQVKHLYYLY